MKIIKITVFAALLLFGAAGCADLDVVNPNQADTERVLATPADVEALIASSYNTWWHSVHGPGFQPRATSQLGPMAHEWQAMAANFGMVQMSKLPREPLANSVADAYFDDYFNTWFNGYSAIKAANDGIQFIDEGGVIGDAARTARARTFAKFVQAISHGYIALLHDQGFVLSEERNITDDPLTAEDLVGYNELMAAALNMLDETIALAQANTFTLPEGWVPGLAPTSQDLVRIAHSYKARFRAEVARTPAERANVTWSQVIADVDAGITASFRPVMDNVNWRHVLTVYGSFGGAWNQVDNFILGMADQSGGYQAWRDTPLIDRRGFLYITPDQRFPQGATRDEQEANRGLYYRYKGESGWVREDRGPWRWSYYYDDRESNNLHDDWMGPHREIDIAEMRLLKAEGLLRANPSDPEGIALIDETRVGNGGLGSAASNVDCVPRLPDGSCGDIMEMLKWEKRIETYQSRMGSWYFDSRGWGDLAAGTPLHYPVPSQELQILQTPVYTTGGVGADGSAPVGTYGIDGDG